MPLDAITISRRLLLTSLLVSSFSANAQSFPKRPITIVVPYSPGGPTDQHLRVIAEQASVTLGQPVVIQNRPGGNATFSASSIKHATADGYTLAVLPLSVFREPYLNRVDYDPRKDFHYIILLSDYVFGFVVRPDAPWKNWTDLKNAALKEPGRISVGGTGATASARILVEEVSEAAKVKFNYVPFKGDTDLAQALLAGHIDVAVLSGTAMPHVKAGKLRYLANLMEVRSERIPDLPTLKEQGVNVWMESPYGIAGPQGLPPDVIQKLHDAFRAALNSPKSVDAMEQFNQKARYMGPSDYTNYAMQALESEKKKMLLMRERGLLK